MLTNHHSNTRKHSTWWVQSSYIGEGTDLLTENQKWKRFWRQDSSKCNPITMDGQLKMETHLRRMWSALRHKWGACREMTARGALQAMTLWMGHTNYCAGNHRAGNIMNPQGSVCGRQVPLRADVEGIFRTLIMCRSPPKIGTPLPMTCASHLWPWPWQLSGMMQQASMQTMRSLSSTMISMVQAIVFSQEVESCIWSGRIKSRGRNWMSSYFRQSMVMTSRWRFECGRKNNFQDCKPCD